MVLELDLVTQCVQGVQYWAKETTLKGSCVQGEGSGGVFALPDNLGPGG